MKIKIIVIIVVLLFSQIACGYKYKSMIATQAALIVMSESNLSSDVFKWVSLHVEGSTKRQESSQLANVFDGIVNDINANRITTIDHALDMLSIKSKNTLGDRFDAWSRWMDLLSERFGQLDEQNKLSTLKDFQSQLIKIKKGLQ